MAEHYRYCLCFAVAIFTFCSVFADVPLAEVDAMATLSSESQRDSKGSVILPADTEQEVLFVGRNFSSNTEVAFTLNNLLRGEHCEDDGDISETFHVDTGGLNITNKVKAKVTLPVLEKGSYYFICIKQVQGEDTSWIHQGDDPFVKFSVVKVSSTFMPVWLQMIFITVLLCLSGLFSGLNLGLMSLDKTELQIIEKCGDHQEKKFAKVISPLRKRGNFLLCTLLLGNVLVNNSLTILLDNISNGLVAVIAATAFIVVFGEIVPQAICSRHGLAVGARTRFITYFFMILTFPLSFPISLLLDKILGEEIGQVYNREKLQELVRVTKDFSALDDGEVAIISGALELTKKRVADIMTPIEDVFMLDYNHILNFDTMSEIMKKGYSRIPVFDNDKGNVVALLNIKDLALIDPDDNTPLKTVCKYYQHHLLFVFDDHKLDQMLQDFRQGDNSKKIPRKLPRQDFSSFIQSHDDNQQVITPQMSVAAFQYLSASVELFLEKYISENILKKLIKQNIVVELNPQSHKEHYLYREGVPADYFVLILQGHVEVSIGREQLVFQGGPFTYYGLNALKVSNQILNPSSNSDSIYIKMEPYIPDFSVKAVDSLLFLRIKRAHYIVARRATLMGRNELNSMQEEEAFASEWSHLSKINQCSHNSTENDTSVEIHTENEKADREFEPKKPSYTSNWTPLSSRNDISGLKRSDSKDSNWSFPHSDRQEPDSLENTNMMELRTRLNENQENFDEKGENKKADVSKADDSLEVRNGDRTRSGDGAEGVVGDREANCGRPTSCHSADFDEDGRNLGEFTPLVSKVEAGGDA
ncbi:CNNM2-like protein [Mya arenaria]|uniref:CNNM2-like protein n=1 Tax=Mya arenaria TaxID=6604 RepID=A0ABY7FHH9_MYAAR|nr:CNNM2-like protein [Mya arenaria]